MPSWVVWSIVAIASETWNGSVCVVSTVATSPIPAERGARREARDSASNDDGDGSVGGKCAAQGFRGVV